jgi:elongator complex protein 3
MTPVVSIESETYVKAISSIVDEIIKAYEKQEPVNMTRLKNDVAKTYRLPSMPKVYSIYLR